MNIKGTVLVNILIFLMFFIGCVSDQTTTPITNLTSTPTQIPTPTPSPDVSVFIPTPVPTVSEQEFDEFFGEESNFDESSYIEDASLEVWAEPSRVPFDEEKGWEFIVYAKANNYGVNLEKIKVESYMAGYPENSLIINLQTDDIKKIFGTSYIKANQTISAKESYGKGSRNYIKLMKSSIFKAFEKNLPIEKNSVYLVYEYTFYGKSDNGKNIKASTSVYLLNDK